MIQKNNPPFAGKSVADHEIVSTRIFPTAHTRVFAAFSDPAQLAGWWGPEGFSCSIQEFDLRPGGAWRLTLRGPDGAEYHNEKTFTMVTPPTCVELDHHDQSHGFRMTMSFDIEAADLTRLTWRMVFVHATEAERLRTVITAANEQNFDRLASHLARLPKN